MIHQSVEIKTHKKLPSDFECEKFVDWNPHKMFIVQRANIIKGIKINRCLFASFEKKIFCFAQFFLLFRTSDNLLKSVQKDRKIVNLILFPVPLTMMECRSSGPITSNKTVAWRNASQNFFYGLNSVLCMKVVGFLFEMNFCSWNENLSDFFKLGVYNFHRPRKLRVKFQWAKLRGTRLLQKALTYQSSLHYND